MFQLEIAATSFEDAVNAVAGGADSLEVSRDLPNGGLTPSVEIVRAILAEVSIPAHVIVRPHARDFCYTEREIAEILHDTRQFAQMGVASIVFGAVTTVGDNHLNIALIQKIAQAAAPTPVTVHRALDGCADPEAALKALIGIVPRILTSGPASNAWDGRAVTRRWVEGYERHFQFVLSGGIRIEQLAELTATRAPVYHIGGAARTDNAVDPAKVRRLRAALG